MAQSLDKKLVISTATIALQEQLMSSDLPNVSENSGLEFSFALAKGRGRYFCLSKSNLTLRNEKPGGKGSAAMLFPDEFPSVNDNEYKSIEALTSQFVQGDWNGDRDE